MLHTQELLEKLHETFADNKPTFYVDLHSIPYPDFRLKNYVFNSGNLSVQKSFTPSHLFQWSDYELIFTNSFYEITEAFLRFGLENPHGPSTYGLIFTEAVRIQPDTY